MASALTADGAAARREPRRTTWLAGRPSAGLLLPVALAIGIAVYAGLDREPAILLIWGAAGFAVLAGGAALWWRRRGTAGLLIAAALACGFAGAALETRLVAAPMLDWRVSAGPVTGQVRAVQPLGQGAYRVVLTGIAGPRLAGRPIPDAVRVRLVSGDGAPPIGSAIRVRAVLTPPSGPAEPGAFDFRRYLFYRGIGGLGFAVGHWQAVDPDPAGSAPLTAPLDRLRLEIAATIRDRADGQAVGAVAAALLTGERRAVPEAVMEALRASGLAHLMAISGLHVGLMAGTVFFALRLALAAVPGLALRYPIKKWAAAAAIVAAFVYTALVGAPVPTQRAFVMTGLALTAILLDRSPFSLRLVAWAAALVLLIAPHSLLEPSFQMSFAAVIGLVAAFERLQQPLTRLSHRDLPMAGILAYLGAVLLTTLVATLATAPFAAYHFNRIALYGLLGNLVAVPLTALWIMPWGLVVLVTLPLGLSALPLAAMTGGIGVLIDWAGWIAGLPGAMLGVPAVPVWSLLAMVAGGLWLCLWRDRLRWLGLLVVLPALAGPASPPAHDVLISEDTRLVAVRDAAGQLRLSSTRRGRFVAEQWSERRAQGPAASWADGLGDPGLEGVGLGCDALGCVYTRNGWRVAVAAARAALDDDCRHADIVIAPFFLDDRFTDRCPALVIDRGTLADDGAHALTLAPAGIAVDTSIADAGGRPWNRGWPGFAEIERPGAAAAQP